MRIVTIALAVGMVLGAGEGQAAPPPLVITTLPFDNPGQQQAVFGLLSRRLGEALHRDVRFEAGKSYADTIDKLASGRSDVGFLGAAAYVRARRKGQVRAILRAIRHQHSTYYGIIVVRRGSSIKTLADLAGKKVAFVDRSSGAGYLYPRLLLKSAGIDPAKDIEAVFAGGHHKVVAEVAAGRVDAGACFEGAQDTLPDPEAVVPIARTEPVPGDPVVVRPGLGPELIRNLRSALIEMSTVPEAKPFFTFSEIDGFVPAVDADYDRVAELLRHAD